MASAAPVLRDVSLDDKYALESGRVFLHETDHLDGVLMFDRMEKSERKRALKLWREQGSTGVRSGEHAL